MLSTATAENAEMRICSGSERAESDQMIHILYLFGYNIDKITLNYTRTDINKEKTVDNIPDKV